MQSNYDVLRFDLPRQITEYVHGWMDADSAALAWRVSRRTAARWMRTYAEQLRVRYVLLVYTDGNNVYDCRVVVCCPADLPVPVMHQGVDGIIFREDIDDD